MDVFPNGDASLPSAFTVLPNVIQKSKRSVIAQGLLDFLLHSRGHAYRLPEVGSFFHCLRR